MWIPSCPENGWFLLVLLILGVLLPVTTAVSARPAAAAPAIPDWGFDRQPATAEQFYFVLPDRFANGDTGQRPRRPAPATGSPPATTPPTRASTTAATSGA